MIAPGEVHAVAAPGQSGVTSVVTCDDTPPIASGELQPGVCGLKVMVLGMLDAPVQSR